MQIDTLYFSYTQYVSWPFAYTHGFVFGIRTAFQSFFLFSIYYFNLVWLYYFVTLTRLGEYVVPIPFVW